MCVSAGRDQRNLKLLGVTTDGSPLYPEPLALIFPGVPHQVCEFHVLKEINKQILKAVTAVRRELKKKLPKLKRGRPSSQAARKAARRKKKLQDKISDLFEHRYLFVKHSLSSFAVFCHGIDAPTGPYTYSAFLCNFE